MIQVKLRKLRSPLDSASRRVDSGAWVSDKGYAVLRTEGRGRDMFRPHVLANRNKADGRPHRFAVLSSDDVYATSLSYGSGGSWADCYTARDGAEVLAYTDTLRGARESIARLIHDRDRDSDRDSESESDRDLTHRADEIEAFFDLPAVGR